MEINNHREVNHWDRRFLGLAEHVAQWSHDPSTKIGAVIVDDEHRIVSLGFNGFPVGIEDSPERLNNRELKYKLTVHGERNAMLFANRSLKGCTLYTVPFMPCTTCAGMIIQSGISEVIAPYSDNERWLEEFELASSMFEESGRVKLILV